MNSKNSTNNFPLPPNTRLVSQLSTNEKIQSPIPYKNNNNLHQRPPQSKSEKILRWASESPLNSRRNPLHQRSNSGIVTPNLSNAKAFIRQKTYSDGTPLANRKRSSGGSAGRPPPHPSLMQFKNMRQASGSAEILDNSKMQNEKTKDRQRKISNCTKKFQMKRNSNIPGLSKLAFQSNSNSSLLNMDFSNNNSPIYSESQHIKLNDMTPSTYEMSRLLNDLHQSEEMTIPFGNKKITQLITSDQITNGIKAELGRGAYGSVYKVVINRQKLEVNSKNNLEPLEISQTIPTFCKIAVKKVPLNIDRYNNSENDLKILKREMCIKDMDCQFCVDYYGTILFEGHIHICMEILDTSLEKFYEAAYGIGAFSHLGNFLRSLEFAENFRVCAKIGTQRSTTNPNQPPRTVIVPHMPEPFIGYFLYCVISGLKYVKENKNKMHRDIKPSNILIKGGGFGNPNHRADYCQIKLCDFGISGELVNSIAKTQAIGCEPFFAPERIDVNAKERGYSVASDIWSLGVTTIEVATGKYPFNNGSKKGATIFKLMSEFGLLLKDNPENIDNMQDSPENENEQFFNPDEMMDDSNHSKNKREMVPLSSLPQPLATLNKHLYTSKLIEFINRTLQKNPGNRPDYSQLIELPIFKTYQNLENLFATNNMRDYPGFDLNRFVNMVLDRVFSVS